MDLTLCVLRPQTPRNGGCHAVTFPQRWPVTATRAQEDVCLEGGRKTCPSHSRSRDPGETIGNGCGRGGRARAVHTRPAPVWTWGGAGDGAANGAASPLCLQGAVGFRKRPHMKKQDCLEQKGQDPPRPGTHILAAQNPLPGKKLRDPIRSSCPGMSMFSFTPQMPTTAHRCPALRQVLG